MVKSNLANNSYIVPGLAFGCNVGDVQFVTSELLIAAAESVCDMIDKECKKKR